MAVTSKLERYRSISTLGSGGMATVTLAEDQVLGRLVALKRMTVAGDVRGLSRLRREALIGASLSHPNLVSIYDIIASEDGEQVIVMEYVPGETLSDALNREGKLPAAEALRILGNLATGLDAIHRQGIVHRDVKPANILLGANGTIKLADLGIASVSDRTRITTTGAILGSFRYMAPEQLDNQRSTPAIDIYALSAVAFEVLSGRKARGEPNPLALAHAISTQPPPDLRGAWPEAPAGAAEVLMRGMARDPAMRPSSASELTGRLRAALLPEPTVQEPARPAPASPVVVPESSAPAAVPEPPARAEEPQPSPPVAAARVPARRKASPPIDVSPRAAHPSGTAGNRSRRGPLAAALLALAAVVVLAVILSSGGSSPPKKLSTASASHPSRPTASRPHARAKKSGAAAATGETAVAGSTGAATPGSSAAAGSTAAGTPGTSAGAGSTGSPASSTNSGAASPGSQSSSPPAAGETAGAATGNPISAVESFYGLAASHRYGEAWALADPTFRNQLASYQSFQAGQAGDRSITFDSAKLVSQSGNAATVALSTTSVRTDGTHHCGGTVDLQRPSPSAGWLLHLIHINCS